MFESKNYTISDFLQPLIEKQYVKNVSLFNFKHKKMNLHKHIFVKPFKVSFLFLYPMKTSENPEVFRCYQGVQIGNIAPKWVNKRSTISFNKP